MSDLQILGIPGSLRRASFNRGLLRTAQAVAPEGVEITIFDLIDLPLYNGDVDAAGKPEAVLELQGRIADADALLVATPEYNGSYSGVLKNAVDWASRRYERPVFAEKPVAIIGAGGRLGTARAQMALRQLLHGQGCYVLPRPQVQVRRAFEHFDASGNLEDEEVRKNVAELVEALAQWTRRLRRD